MRRYFMALGIFCLIIVLACGLAPGPADDMIQPDRAEEPAPPSGDGGAPSNIAQPPSTTESPDIETGEAEPEKDIETAILACWAAYNERDWEAYLGHCTGYSDPHMFLLQSQTARELTGEVAIAGISDIQVNGTTATAVVTVSSEHGTRSAPCTLRDEDGWKLVAGPAE